MIARLVENNKLDTLLVRELLRQKVMSFASDPGLEYITNSDTDYNMTLEKATLAGLINLVRPRKQTISTIIK